MTIRGVETQDSDGRRWDAVCTWLLTWLEAHSS